MFQVFVTQYQRDKILDYTLHKINAGINIVNKYININTLYEPSQTIIWPVTHDDTNHDFMHMISTNLNCSISYFGIWNTAY